MKNIHQVEWLELLANDTQAIIIDARTPRECAEGIIENAIMINFLDTIAFKTTVEKLDKNKNYYVYCRSGNRSAQACQLLENLGVEHTYNLSGGMMAWTGKTVVPV
ncbi:rhodanese-like domain-containing protein [Dokdonia ponticola]|uniref:Rhodanese-like domain-containing protein n=1 Tax=Dokdonia ponticola TaxID=2041041 RepID=A0ABV9HTI5_9FLAO